MSAYLRDTQLRRQLEEKVKEAARTRQAAEEGLQAARTVLDAGRQVDADVAEAAKPFAEAEAAMASREYKLAADKAREAKERGERIYRARVTAILESSRALVDLARDMKGDISDADASVKKSQDALAADDVDTAVDQAKKAWKRAEKVLLEHLSTSFSRAQALILSAKNLGRDAAPVEDLLSRARAAMESNDLPAAASYTKECLDTVTEDLQSVMDKETVDTEELLRTAQSLGAEAGKVPALIERSRKDVANLDFEKARNALRQGRTEAEKAIQQALGGRAAHFARFIQEAKGIGADTVPAEALFTRAEAALRGSQYKEGASLAQQGFQALQQAQFQQVLKTVAASREKFVAAVQLGLDLSGPLAQLNQARECLQRNAFRDAIEWAKKADAAVEQAAGRYRKAEDRLRDLHRALNEAEASGLATPGARRAAEQARDAYQRRASADFQHAIETAFAELRTAERGRVSEALQQAEDILHLSQKHGVDAGEAARIFEAADLAAKSGETRKALDLAAQAQSKADALITNHVADQIANLRDLLPQLGEATNTVRTFLDRAEGLSSARDHDAALLALAEAHSAVGGLTTAAASEAVEDLALCVRMGADLGADVSLVDSLYSELSGWLAEGKGSMVLGSRDRIRATLGTASDGLFNLVKARVAQAQVLKMDIEGMRELLKRSKMALSIENYHEGLVHLEKCAAEVNRATAAHREAQTTLASAAALLAEAKKRDVDVSRALELLLEGKRAFEQLDYERVMEFAAKARAETEKLMVLYASAQKILSSRERMELAARIGIDAPHLRDSLTEAKEAMKAKEYERALALGQRSEEEITKLIQDRIRALLDATEAAMAPAPESGPTPLGQDISKVRELLDAGQLAPAADAALRMHDELGKLKTHADETRTAIQRVKDLLTDVEAMSLEAPGTLRLLEQSEAVSRSGQFDEALDFAAKAEAEAAKERDKGIATLMRRFEEAVERANIDGTDTRSAREMLERARGLLRAKKYRQAISVAMRSEGEVERVALQQSMASQAVEAIERKLRDSRHPAPKVDAIVVEARKDLEAGEFVKALDKAIRASDGLSESRERAEEAVDLRDRVRALLATAQEVGADATKFSSIIEEGDAAYQQGNFPTAEAAFRQALEWGQGLVRAHLKDLLGLAQGLVPVCTRLGVDATSAQNHYAQARTRIESEDFAEAYMCIVEGRLVAEEALRSKLTALLSEASGSIAHSKKLGTDVREAEARLAEAERLIGRGEFENGLALIERSLEQVESVKVVEKRFVDLTYKAESTIRNGKKFGIDMRPAERKLADAMAMFKENLPEAIRSAEESYRLAWEAMESFAPSLDATLDIGSAQVNEWTEASLSLRNVGKGLAKNVRVRILGDAVTEEIPEVLAIRAKAQETLRIRIKMTAPGSVPLAIQITAHRVFDDKEYVREIVAHAEVSGESREAPSPGEGDVEARCPICRGLIKSGYAVMQCACGRDFHEACASRVGRCPVCFRTLAGGAR